MSHTPHELAEEFPQHVDRMHALKGSNAHFARLFDEYHTLNRQIHRADADIEPMEDLALEQLKKQRLHMLDEIKKMLEA